MPVISNATVATGTGLSTAGSGRKLVRLSNGWWVIAVGVQASNQIRLLVSKDNFATSPTQLCFITEGSPTFSIVNKGTKVYVVFNFEGQSDKVRVATIEATTVSNVDVTATAQQVESSQSSLGKNSLAINDAGTELHAAWSSKNATYPNSFNIRYAKGAINGDGSVTWGAVEQVSKVNTVGEDIKNPSVVVYKDGEATIFVEFKQFSNYYIQPLKKIGLPTALNSNYNWTSGLAFNGGANVQSNPSALFAPTAINGLANGRLWVAWHGKDATDSAKFNIRVSYSDDGGVTWAAADKITVGNTYDRLNVSLSADKTGKVFALYEDHQWAPDIDIYMRTFSGGSWGAPVAVAVAEPAAETNPSALVDFSLQMTTPPFVYTDTTLGIRFTGNFNAGASVSPASGALGNKETTSLTAYTVTPEAGSTVTQIVERINGTIVNTFNNPASLSRTLTAPNATWDTLAYFATHTASVTVTDSNGAQTVTTYSFDKTLSNVASLSEATKANTDAKNRISQKRDLLATQVGLSAGSTFDAILGAFGSSVVKKQEGSATSSSTTLPFVGGNGSNNNANSVTVAGLTFLPTVINLHTSDGLTTVKFDANTPGLVKIDYLENRGASVVGATFRLDGVNAYVNSSGFRLPTFKPNTLHSWKAFS